MFLFLAFLNIIVMLQVHFIMGTGDSTMMHVPRIVGLIRDINSQSIIHFLFNLPQVNLYSMNQNGSAAFSLYPYITLLPICLFFKIIPFSVNSFNICVMLVLFIGFLISYYSCKDFSKNIPVSILFSTLYVSSTSITSSFFNGGDIPTCLSILFFPIVIFGFRKFLRNGSWAELSTGIILLIYTHILSTILAILFLIIWLIINLKVLKNTKRIINLIKAILITILFTGIVWLPLWNILGHNTINKPFAFSLNTVSVSLYSDLFRSYFPPTQSNVVIPLGCTALLGLIITPFIFKKLNKLDKQAYVLAIIILIISSNSLPWGNITSPFIKIIQFPNRLDFIPQMLFCYLLSIGLIKYLNYNQIITNINKFIPTFNTHNISRNAHLLRIIFIIFTICISMLVQINTQKGFFYGVKPWNNLTSSLFDQNTNFRNRYVHNGAQFAFKIHKNNQLKYLLSPFSVEQTPDYYPKASFPMNNLLSQSRGLFNINQTLQFKDKGNGLITGDAPTNIQELNLPVVVYHGIHYHVKDNGKYIPAHANNTSLLTINNVKKGTHNIQITAGNSTITKLSNSLFILAILWCYYINRNKFIIPYKKHIKR